VPPKQEEDMKLRLATALALALCGGAAMAAPSAIEQAVSDPTRPATDVSRDAGRKPAALLAFAGIKPGMVVVDLLPGTGYFTRMFSNLVGAKGRVYAYFGTQYDARLQAKGQSIGSQLGDVTNLLPNIQVEHGPLEQLSLPEPVDVIWTSDNYHDLFNKQFATDAAAINKKVFAALKPGGIYLVVDHRAAKGAGLPVTESLHRMDEDLAKQQIEAAGFKLVAESDVLANPKDDDTKRVFEAGEHDHTDQFVLKFQKPL
jgi:predicted methyltransferase